MYSHTDIRLLLWYTSPLTTVCAHEAGVVVNPLILFTTRFPRHPIIDDPTGQIYPRSRTAVGWSTVAQVGGLHGGTQLICMMVHSRVASVSWLGSVIYRSCVRYHSGTGILGSAWSIWFICKSWSVRGVFLSILEAAFAIIRTYQVPDKTCIPGTYDERPLWKERVTYACTCTWAWKYPSHTVAVTERGDERTLQRKS